MLTNQLSLSDDEFMGFLIQGEGFASVEGSIDFYIVATLHFRHPYEAMSIKIRCLVATAAKILHKKKIKQWKHEKTQTFTACSCNKVFLWNVRYTITTAVWEARK